MSNSTADIPIAGVGQDGRRFHWPVKTAQAIYTGTMVAQQVTDGLLIPATATGAGRVIGKALQTIASASAAERCLVETGRTYLLSNGSDSNAFSEASLYGAPAYAFDDHTVYDNSVGDTLKFAGYFQGMEADGKVRVFIPDFDAAAIDESEVGGDLVTTFRARNVVNGNIADLAAYTVASSAAVNDATLNVEGDVVLLVAQTTAAQNGLYVVGVVAAGVAPLTRHPAMPASLVFRADDFDVVIAAGTLFAHTRWFNSAAGTIGTNAPAFFPESVTFSQVLTAGTATAIQSVPLLSATKSNILYTRTTTGGTLTNTVGYQTVPAPTPGAIGTASIVPMAVVAAGTVQNLDTSTLLVTVVNR
jgi:hypothetical protein